MPNPPTLSDSRPILMTGDIEQDKKDIATVNTSPNSKQEKQPCKTD
jgi:ribosomal protein L29